MLKLMKWAFYGLMGYALYELYLGVMQGGGGGQAQPSGQGQANQDQESGSRTAGRMTGAGRGITQFSQEQSSGASVPHQVGRGVIH